SGCQHARGRYFPTTVVRLTPTYLYYGPLGLAALPPPSRGRRRAGGCRDISAGRPRPSRLGHSTIGLMAFLACPAPLEPRIRFADRLRSAPPQDEGWGRCRLIPLAPPHQPSPSGLTRGFCTTGWRVRGAQPWARLIDSVGVCADIAKYSALGSSQRVTLGGC